MKLITVMIVGNTNKKLMDFSIASTIKNTPHIEDIVIFDSKKLKDNFSIDDYSYFALKNMWAFVKTEFVLIIQYDGMAANRQMWSDDFLKYDYIGAPWPERFNWIGENERVGNGGFSLRSAKLLNALRDPIIHPRQDIRFKNEDATICQGYSKYLSTKHDIKFAPVSVANVFSHEWCNPSGETYGFHGMWNFPLFFEEKTCLDFMLDIPKNYWYNDRYDMFLKTCENRGFKTLSSSITEILKNE